MYVYCVCFAHTQTFASYYIRPRLSPVSPFLTRYLALYLTYASLSRCRSILLSLYTAVRSLSLYLDSLFLSLSLSLTHTFCALLFSRYPWLPIYSASVAVIFFGILLGVSNKLTV